MNKPDHINQMNANDKLINELLFNKTKFFDWIIIVMFYASLHKIDYLLHQKNINSRVLRNHMVRNSKVFQNLPQKLYNSYNTLYLESVRVRYKQVNLFSISLEDLRKYFKHWRKIKKV